MTKTVAVVKGIVKTKAFWSLVAVVAAAVLTPAGATIVKMAEAVSCAALGGCV